MIFNFFHIFIALLIALLMPILIYCKKKPEAGICGAVAALWRQNFRFSFSLI